MTPPLDAYVSGIYERVRKQWEAAVQMLRERRPDLESQMSHDKFSIFYSNPYTTLRESALVVMGLNPHGATHEEYDVPSSKEWKRLGARSA